MKYVYMLQFDWSTNDADGIETELFRNYDDAYTHYKKTIANELNPEMSWVGSEVFDENGNVNDGYELDKGKNYWHVVDKNDYYRHSFIDLIKKEIH